MCVFIGYPTGIKGYKLYDIQTKQVFVSRDVVFHKEVFPFHSFTDVNPTVDPFTDLVLPSPSLNSPIPPNQHTTPNSPIPPDQYTTLNSLFLDNTSPVSIPHTLSQIPF